MSTIVSSPMKSEASPVLLWLAWGSVAYFAAMFACLKLRLSVAPPIDYFLWIGYILSSWALAAGGMIAAGYVLASIWVRTRILSGISAFVANVACLIYFVDTLTH